MLFRSENDAIIREYPEDYGVVFFQGWSSYSKAEKIEAVRDAKKVLDRTLKAK